MTYPVNAFNYSTRRQRRDQLDSFQTIGGNLLRVDTTIDKGETIQLEHVVPWSDWLSLVDHYGANFETTFNITIDSDTISVRYLDAPQITGKNGGQYRVTVNVGRVL